MSWIKVLRRATHLALLNAFRREQIRHTVRSLAQTLALSTCSTKRSKPTPRQPQAGPAVRSEDTAVVKKLGEATNYVIASPSCESSVPRDLSDGTHLRLRQVLCCVSEEEFRPVMRPLELSDRLVVIP